MDVRTAVAHQAGKPWLRRVRLNASRKNGFVSTVSARALNVAILASLSDLLHHRGISAQRVRTKSRLPSCSVTTSTGSVGQMLYRGGILCGGAGNASL